MANNLTVTYKGNTIHTASASGSATLETGGTWCEGDIGLSYTFDAAAATLAVVVTNGTATNVTATKSGTSISLTYDSTIGAWTEELPSFGTWTVSATDGTHSQSDIVNASLAGLYTLSLRLQDIPNAYTQLEWISTSELTYISTSYKPTASSCRFYGKARPTVAVTSNTYYAISAGGVWPTAYQWWGLEWRPSVIEYWNGIYRNDNKYPGLDTKTLSTSTTYTFSTNGRTITINGTQYTITLGGNIDSSVSIEYLYLGQCAKTWYWQCTQADGVTLALDLVPARRNSDSVVGMFDKVNNVFYGPSGAGVFTAGPAV